MNESILKTIPAFYKKNALSQLMYGYVCGVQSTMQTIGLKAAIEMFKDTFNLSEDELNTESAIVTFHRMRNDYFKTQNSINNEARNH
jgi:hypothetical protein